MLWCHAYNASHTRDARDACVRWPDRMEVGRRERSDALLRSCGSRRHAHGAQCGLRPVTLTSASQHCAGRSGGSDFGSTSHFGIPELRNLEAGQGRHHLEHRRRSRREHSCGPRATARPLCSPLSGRTSGRGLKRFVDRILPARSCSWTPYVDGGHHGSAWRERSEERTRHIRCTANISCQSSRGASPTQPSQAAPNWGVIQQASKKPTFIRGPQRRRACANRSSNQPACQGSHACAEETVRVFSRAPPRHRPTSVRNLHARAAEQPSGCF
jgi:hypothetical protein